MTQRSGASGGGSSGTIGAGIMPRGKLVNGGVTLDAVPARESSYTTRSAGSGELPSPGSGGGVGFSKHSAGAAAMRRGVLDESLIAVGRVHSSTEAPPEGMGQCRATSAACWLRPTPRNRWCRRQRSPACWNDKVEGARGRFALAAS